MCGDELWRSSWFVRTSRSTGRACLAPAGTVERPSRFWDLLWGREELVDVPTVKVCASVK